MRAMRRAAVFLSACLALVVAPAAEASAADDRPSDGASCSAPCNMWFYFKGDGAGRITIEVPGAATKDCSTTCNTSLDFPQNDSGVATIRAIPAAGSYFAGWENCPPGAQTGDSPPACQIDSGDFFLSDILCVTFVSSAPPSLACPPAGDGGGGGGGGSGDTLAPATRITAGPSPGGTTRKRSATFRFASSESGSTFICRLDSKPWLPCRSPKTYRGFKPGVHTFRVKAIDRAGNLDPTPALRRWRILR